METGRRPQGSKKMELEVCSWNVYANGTFWGTYDADSAEEAVRLAASDAQPGDDAVNMTVEPAAYH
jgi:hypothetical protein